MEDASDNYFYNELNILNHNDGIEVLQYGNIDSTQGISTTGFGTYHAYIDGSNIKVDIIPTVGTAITANTSVVAISTNSSGVTTTSMIVTNLSSYFKSIASSGSPTENIIASYEDPFASEYVMISVEDTTNEEIKLLKVHALDSYNEGWTKYRQIITNSCLGNFGLTKSGTSIY